MIGRISPAIPALRKIKDHIEAEFSHFRRGKSHTSPEAEEDIQKLQDALSQSRVHVYDGTRTSSSSKITDYMAVGSDIEKVTKALEQFHAKRDRGQSTEELWPESDTVNHSTTQ